MLSSGAPSSKRTLSRPFSSVSASTSKLSLFLQEQEGSLPAPQTPHRQAGNEGKPQRVEEKNRETKQNLAVCALKNHLQLRKRNTFSDNLKLGICCQKTTFKNFIEAECGGSHL